jgi:hypothetical protein
MATSERNAQGVDVLAVMDGEIADLEGMVVDWAERKRMVLREARDAVAELIEAAKEDIARPVTVTLDYRSQRKPDEPEGYEWWKQKRAELDAAGYYMMHEDDDGSELFVYGGNNDRLRAALAKFTEPRL